MKIIFAGTGSGKTSLKRYHSSTLFSSADFNLLLDAGDGVSRALMNSQIDFNSIDAILFSHFHPDHLNGISSLLIQMKMNKREKSLRLLVHSNLYSSFIKFLETGYVFKERMGFDINILTYSTDSFFRVSKDIGFISRENSHLKKYETSAEDSGLLISSSFLLFVESKRVFCSGDIGSVEDLYLFENEKFDAFLTEVTHIDIALLKKVLLRINPERVFINHLSDESQEELQLWLSSLPVSLRERIFLTHDAMSVTI